MKDTPTATVTAKTTSLGMTVPPLPNNGAKNMVRVWNEEILRRVGTKDPARWSRSIPWCFIPGFHSMWSAGRQVRRNGNESQIQRRYEERISFWLMRRRAREYNTKCPYLNDLMFTAQIYGNIED